MSDPCPPGSTQVLKRASHTAEGQRLAADVAREANWKRWGPYLSERQWSTVREDYSASGECWEYFPHDQARSRAYRWGEDGLLGFCDRRCRLCFSIALWNGRDPILKERLFGLTNAEGNHGEDAKEEWFYLDSTPTHSHVVGLYKYPQSEFPYSQLVEENRRRSRHEPEFELHETGIFDQDRYWDVEVTYAKQSPDDLLIRIRVTNRGPDPAPIHLLPTLWFRNTWTWDCSHEGCSPRPRLSAANDRVVHAIHDSLETFHLEVGPAPDGSQPDLLFTDNETDTALLFGTPNSSPFVKNAFHRHVIHGQPSVLNPARSGTKVAAHHFQIVPPGAAFSVELRLVAATQHALPDRASPLPGSPIPTADIFRSRQHEADAYYDAILCPAMNPEERRVARQAYAGLLWSKQFYQYVVEDWLRGDPAFPAPPDSRRSGRNHEWKHLHARDVLSMPDKWEYPWFAAWDLAFHMVPFATVDGEFAKQQLSLLLREWYMHPNGQLPAYEFHLGDVNPPVHAWAAWRVYKLTGPRGARDRDFLESVFQKLLLNFTWWVNRKDATGKNLFSGGFLGLDNIGVFDRSRPLPGGGSLQQADGTAWMAFYCSTMLAMALELAHDGERVRPAYEDMASKFLEHFVQIAEAMNTVGGSGLWDEQDGFYYDQLEVNGQSFPLRTRSMVGLLPLIAVEVLDEDDIARLPGFRKRLDWFITHKHSLQRGIALGRSNSRRKILLAIPTRDRLRRVLRYLFDPAEFLSPFGIRSLSRHHEQHPFVFHHDGARYDVGYVPAESTTNLFGGNSNWRGPIWFPVNYLIEEALERYHLFYGDDFTVELPSASGQAVTLRQAALDLERRLASLFLPAPDGTRPALADNPKFASDPHWRDLLQFHEFFHAETGRGCGANHQTGWTALVIRHLEDIARERQ
jgi:hypothetical protein